MTTEAAPLTAGTHTGPAGTSIIKPSYHPRLTNEDLAPLVEQKWNWYNIFAFWMADVHSVGGYVTAGALAGFSGLLHSSMIWLANPRDFVGLELDVIAAVVLGGASIFGGRGTVLGTVLGVFILVMIQNSLILMGIDTTWQRVVVGAMLVAAVTVTALRDRRALV